MYEEEYFVGVLPQKNNDVLIYKYFSELSQEQMEHHNENHDPLHLERGNLLG
jgi:hypothetical protein